MERGWQDSSITSHELVFILLGRDGTKSKAIQGHEVYHRNY